MAEEMLSGHEDLIGFRLPDGTLSTDAVEPAGTIGYRARCRCGWIGGRARRSAQKRPQNGHARAER
jgi:hypothetical protein